MKNAHDIIISPIITEKSVDGMDELKYTFRVDKRANKTDIKNAIEEIFDGVKVKKVNTMNVSGKVRRRGLQLGKTPDWKKAIVTLTDDSKEIEFFEGL